METVLKYFLYGSYAITGIFFIACILLIISLVKIQSRVWKNYKRRR